MKRFFLPICLGISTLTMSAAAQQDPLKVTQEIMLAVCGKPLNTGSETNFSVSGDAEAKLDGLISKFVGLGLQGAASFDSKEYVTGLNQAQLAGELPSIRNCNLKVYNDFSPLIIQWMQPAPDAQGRSSGSITSNGACTNNISGSGSNVTSNCSTTGN